jgi:hypothetical protein
MAHSSEHRPRRSHIYAALVLLAGACGLEGTPQSRALARLEDVSIDDEPEDLPKVDGLHSMIARPAPPGTGFVPDKKAWILWLNRAVVADTNNQQSYRAVLETFGYKSSVVKLADFTRAPADPETVLVVPRGAGALLSQRQQQEILRYLAAGGALVADGRQEWLGGLGLRWLGGTVSVSTVADLLFPEMPLRWQGQDPVERFAPPEGVRELMVDKESKQVLAFLGKHGAGRYIYLAAPLDPHTQEAISHYPYFPKYLTEAFGTSASLRSPHLEAYFDPSFRAGADLNRLAAAWRESGIRTIYVAAWLFSREYSFNYGEFIETCHRNGLSVYAWFVFPAVTQKMWDEHPEWRERTATGADGRVGWRYSMNFQNPVCFRAAMDWMSGLLRAHPWDGVNLTELNYDADFDNYLRADRFVPMNEQVQREFQRRSGFDPALLFKEDSGYYHKRNPGALHTFLRYREEIVLDWHRRVLKELEPLRRAQNWEVIVTMLDSLHSSYVRPALGVDSRRIVGLMRQFDFTLQVEDPAHHWAQPPDRYRRFAKTYLKLVPEARRLMFDVNVMPDRDVAHTTLPSATATGTELARTVAAAAWASGRVAIYSEHTVPVEDWVFLKTALTRPASLKAGRRKWKVDSPPRAARSSGSRPSGLK